MATSGSKKINVESTGHIYLLFSWTAGTQDVTNNYTPVNWNLKIVSTGSGANIQSTAKKDYSVTVDGQTWKGTNTIGLAAGATKTLASGTKNIYHNSDGTKTFSYSFSQEIAITFSGSWIGTKTGSGNGTLNTIPRGSVLGTVSNFTIGNAITVPITKYSSSFTDTLEISVGGTVVKTVSDISNNASVSFTTTELNNIYAKLPTVTSGTFTFKTTTKSGSTTIGTSTKTAKGTISSTVKPTISSVSLVEGTSGLAAQFGSFIQSKSTINGTVNATAGTGSSIESYKVVINGSTYTSRTFTTGVLKTSGSNSYSVTVTDKRGRTASTSGTFTVTAYTSPTITTFTVVRSNADGTGNDEGTYAKINATATINSLNSKNTKSFTLQYKLKSASSWTTIETYTAGYTYTVTNKLVSNINVDNPYDFRIVATDYFGTVNSKTIDLSTAYTIMDIKANGKGIAFGKVATENNVIDVGFNKANLSTNVFMHGDYTSDNEKKINFNNTTNATNHHDTYFYGANSNSTSSIGLYDRAKNRSVWSYKTSTNEFVFNQSLKLLLGSYGIEAVQTKASSSATGRYQTKEGLLIQWGSVSITPVAHTPTGVNVTFPIAYSTIPDIQVSLVSAAPYTNVLGYSHSNDSATGTTLHVTRTNTIATVLRWFAIGIK